MRVLDCVFRMDYGNKHAKLPKAYRRALFAGSTTALALILFAAQMGSVQAQSGPRLPTQNQTDPRRASHAAKVTTEPAPDRDQEGHEDSARVDEAYQPKGIELGSFLLLPLLETDLQYNSNLFAQEKNPKGDLSTRIAPELKLRSRFATHALNITARAEQYLYKTYSDDNHTDASLLVDGRYDIERGSEATLLIDAGQRYEDRGSPDAAGGKTPTPTRSAQGTLGAKHQLGRYTFSGDVTSARRVYDNVETDRGTVINNHDRDRWENGVTGRASYEVFPGYAAVAEVSANSRNYDDRLDDAGYDRSSYGYRANAGIGIDISQLIRGDFLVGYLYQNYRDARLKDPSGLSFRATFNWTPSRLTVIVPSLERSVLETTQTNASAMVRTGFNLLVRHEYERNIVLTGIANVNYDQYEGLSRSSWTYEARGRVIYAFNPELYTGGEIGYRKRDSELQGQSFQQVVMLLRLGVRM